MTHNTGDLHENRIAPRGLAKDGVEHWEMLAAHELVELGHRAAAVRSCLRKFLS
jgi:hypothetical protein